MSLRDKLKRDSPVRWRWEWFKLSVTEALSRWFRIHIDW